MFIFNINFKYVKKYQLTEDRTLRYLDSIVLEEDLTARSMLI